MTENIDFTSVPEATSVPKKGKGFTIVWVIPVVAALVGLGIVVQRYLNEGPTIRFTLRTAEGVEAGKTFVKYKEIEIGKVTEVTLSDNFSKCIVTVKMAKQAEKLLVEDSRFWVVKPRVTLSGVSGIGTLLSGNYIGFEPGKSGQKRRDFVGLEVPPPITAGLPGREFVLRAETLGSVGIGSPLYYRNLNVGQVTAYDLAKDGKSVDIRVFLDAPYDRYVTTNTRFWEASGIHASLGANGFSVRTQSVLSLLIGGIAFETPPSAQAAAPTAATTVFTLHNDRSAALAPLEADSQRYVLYFNESLRGLSVGAPVNILGLPIGEVTEVSLEYDPSTKGFRPRVQIVTYPYRVFLQLEKSSRAMAKSMTQKERNDILQQMVVDKGLRAQLRSGSLISGQLLVALDYFPDAPKAKIDWTREPPRFPVVPGQLASLETKIENIVAKLDKVPVEEIGEDMRKAMATLDQTLQSANRTLTRIDAETLPEAKKTLEDLRRALTAAERVLNSADNTLLGPDAPAQQELRDALQEIARSARAIRLLADSLERNPESLLRGKNKENP
jgi:paraquat-inducible protein B